MKVISSENIEGSFRVSFEGEMSREISLDATNEEMKSALESLSTIGVVDIDSAHSMRTSNLAIWEVGWRLFSIRYISKLIVHHYLYRLHYITKHLFM